MPRRIRKGGDIYDVLYWLVLTNENGAASLGEVAPFKFQSLVRRALVTLVRLGLVDHAPVTGLYQATAWGSYELLALEYPFLKIPHPGPQPTAERYASPL